MVTKAQKAQRWANSKKKYMPMHDMTPTPVNRVKLRLVQKERLGLLEWVVQVRDKTRHYSPGVPATDYMVSLWFDLCEERERVGELKQVISEYDKVIRNLEKVIGDGMP